MRQKHLSFLTLLLLSFGQSKAQQFLANISVANSYTSSDAGFQGEVNGKLIFSAIDTIHGREYWVTDGTPAGTHFLKDVNPGRADVSHYLVYARPFGWEPITGFTFNNFYYFRSGRGYFDQALWKTDGTEEGTTKIRDIGTDTTWINFGYRRPHKKAGPILLNGKPIFGVSDKLKNATLWTTDGTPEGTKMIVDLTVFTSYTGAAAPYYFIVYKNALYFFVRSSDTKMKLMRSNGTQSGTFVVKEMDYFSQPFLLPYKNELFFTATDSIHGTELWKTNGLSSGTVMVKDIWPGTQSGGPVEMNVVNDRLLFFARDPIHDKELWISDGTEEGTKLLKDTYPGKQRTIPQMPGIDMTAFEDRAFFPANDSIHGQEWWVTDGTEQGTHMLKDIGPGTMNGMSLGESYIVKVKDKFYLTARENPYAGGIINIYVTDCSEAGTRKAFTSTAGIRYGARFYSFGDKLFFQGADNYRADPAFLVDSTKLEFVNTVNLQLELFPNPTSSIALAKITNFTPSLAKLSIYDVAGRKVSEQTVDLYCDCRIKNVPIGHLPRGVYFVAVSSRNQRITKKLLVQ